MKGLGKISQNQVASDQVSFVEVDENSAGQRIDNFLTRVCKGVPKSHIYRILRSGEVRVNKGRVDAQYRLEQGDVVRVPPIRVAQTQSYDAASVPSAQFDILFEDDALLVIDKPAGVAVHGGSGVAFGVIEQMREARPREVPRTGAPAGPRDLGRAHAGQEACGARGPARADSR